MKGWEGLPEQSKEMYLGSYFLENETYDKWLVRVTSYCEDINHQIRMMDYIRNYWFHPSTPVSSNAGTTRGLPISCFTNEVEDSKDGIFGNYEENFRLGASGGGIGTDWSNVREIGSKVGIQGKSGGIVPFIKVSDSSTLAISQGGLRRASQAVYLDISHPEILEFLELRKPTGDANRRCLNIHHAVKITDAFMEAVEGRKQWNLISPKTKEIIDSIDAFDLWCKLLETRHQTGEPFILFSDTVDKLKCEQYINNNYTVNTSNLCTEITLHTSNTKSGVCCLGSINLEYWDEIKDKEYFISDCIKYLDLVLQDFINKTEDMPGFEKARNAAIEERSLGLGVMGFHYYLQSKNIPFESVSSISVTNNIFSTINKVAKKFHYRNWNVTAIAPTASISTLCNTTSQGIDPIIANCYTHKTRIGTKFIKNRYLENVLNQYNKNNDDVWKAIVDHKGSVQHLEFLSEADKDIFKTAYELDQNWIIELASHRTKYIDQAQSVNLFFEGDCSRHYLYNVHMRAWKSGLKSLYYCRSTSIGSASLKNIQREVIKEYSECVACQ